MFEIFVQITDDPNSVTLASTVDDSAEAMRRVNNLRNQNFKAWARYTEPVPAEPKEQL
jgi:hypothetical protein